MLLFYTFTYLQFIEFKLNLRFFTFSSLIAQLIVKMCDNHVVELSILYHICTDVWRPPFEFLIKSILTNGNLNGWEKYEMQRLCWSQSLQINNWKTNIYLTLKFTHLCILILAIPFHWILYHFCNSMNEWSFCG